MVDHSFDTFRRKSFLGAIAALFGGFCTVTKAVTDQRDDLATSLRDRGIDPRFDRRVTDYTDPGYSSCARCGVSWRYVDGHTIMVNDGHGLFALCERCWAESSPQERAAFYVACCYSQAFDVHRYNKMHGGHDHNPFTPEQVREAVLRG